MTDAKPGFGPNTKEPSRMNIINPNLGLGFPPNPVGPMSLIKAGMKTQPLCLLTNNNKLGIDSSPQC